MTFRASTYVEAARAKIRNLEAALVTARRIGTAVGIVMATYKVTDTPAHWSTCGGRLRSARTGHPTMAHSRASPSIAQPPR